MRQNRQLRFPIWSPRGWASVMACAAFAGATSSSDAQTPAEAVAAQVRAQGYQCEEPISATRDAGLSKPDSAVWNLKCGNGGYRVRLVPDMAARITKLDKDSR